MIKQFFKRMFCKHVWPNILHSTYCICTIECQKCGKAKKVYLHDYEVIDSFYEEKSSSTMLTSMKHIYLVQVFRCKKCDKVFSRRNLIM